MWIGSSDPPVVAAPFDSSGCHKWWSLGEWQQFTAISTLRHFPSLQQSHFLILKLQITLPLANSKCVLIGQWLYLKKKKTKQDKTSHKDSEVSGVMKEGI